MVKQLVVDHKTHRPFRDALLIEERVYADQAAAHIVAPEPNTFSCAPNFAPSPPRDLDRWLSAEVFAHHLLVQQLQIVHVAFRSDPHASLWRVKLSDFVGVVFCKSPKRFLGLAS